MDIFISALAYIDYTTILVVIGACLFGLFVGAIPGLTSTMAIALMVPFTFFLDPIPALALMISVGASSIFAGDIPGALLNIPGTPASAAYTNDAHTLVKEGKTNRVLGMSLTSSVIGGVIGTIILASTAPLLAEFALKFSSYEYMWLTLIGLSCATIVSGTQIRKSLLALFFGIALATIGYDEFTGQARFTFGEVSLMQGVSFIPAMIGLFAISGAIKYYVDRWKEKQIKLAVNTDNSSYNIFKGVGKVVCRRKGGIFRSGIIGTLIGALPGAGADIAAWISYAVSKKLSKKPQKYGQGSEEGIVDASASNNASLAGSWIPSLVFGIPGDSAAAIIIGVLYMKDMQPGPTLFLFNPDKLYAVFIIFFIANLILLPIAFIVVNFLKKIVAIDNAILYPAIILFSIVGSFAITNTMSSIVVMMVMGVIGYFLQQRNFPISPIILGMILGPMLEKNLLSSLMKSDGELINFVNRPISIVLASVFLLIVAMQIRSAFKTK
ncbi:tripartite tricarboxylate transporter permease [Proteus mirabilis]|nr:tripartite tricarboxylate transporter permease [Proteus mirabilis]MBG3006583.1 tripartite tricarboxylate transporter permease [Proteus mirabilis]MBG3082427.1 tripartite tricarboxylate transporter permease [Proteus mirabilis]MBG3085617.1 tripartite tricarboxylate transporter permease [Proteus mirabilis]MBG5944724.1 tripartite tricarboxylate transporter permease [Proteus mirabilis]